MRPKVEPFLSGLIVPATHRPGLITFSGDPSTPLLKLGPGLKHDTNATSAMKFRLARLYPVPSLRRPDLPLSSSAVVGLLVGTGLIFITFGLCEYWQGERALSSRGCSSVVRYCYRPYSTTLPGAFFATVYYMPIYFQAVRGSSAIISGAQNLPFIVPAMIGALSSGIFISKTGLSTPVMVVGASLATLGCGLCYTFGVDTPIGNWVGYQIVAGVGLGGAFQVPIVVGQASVDPVDLSSVTSMLLSFQVLGGAMFVSAGQSAFVNTLIQSIPSLAPGADPMQVVATGAGQLRSVFSPKDVPGIIASYLRGVGVTFLLDLALTGIALLVAVLYPWKRLDVAAVQERGGAA